MQVPVDIQNRYIERRKRDLEVCLMSFQEANFSELEKIGHQLKGNGKTFGYSELTDIGMTMEQAAHERNLSELEHALKDFSQWVNIHIN